MKKKSFMLHLEGGGEVLITEQGFDYAISKGGLTVVNTADGSEIEVEESLQEISELLESLED